VQFSTKSITVTLKLVGSNSVDQVSIKVCGIGELASQSNAGVTTGTGTGAVEEISVG
jgi:hypothetical protein